MSYLLAVIVVGLCIWYYCNTQKSFKEENKRCKFIEDYYSNYKKKAWGGKDMHICDVCNSKIGDYDADEFGRYTTICNGCGQKYVLCYL